MQKVQPIFVNKKCPPSARKKPDVTLKSVVCFQSFAKRALVKIDELNELEKCSASKSDVTTVPIFRAATIRVGVVVFLKQVYDFKKRQRLMPNRPNKNKSLRDIANVSFQLFHQSFPSFSLTLVFMNPSNHYAIFALCYIYEFCAPYFF